MNKLLIAALIVIVAMSALSCSKSSLDKDPADDYVGNYVLTDTTTYTDPNTSQIITDYTSSSASMSKASATTLNLNMFPNGHCDSLQAQVTANSLVLLSSSSCGNDFPVGFVCTRVGNTLYYTYDFNNLIVIYHIKGKAVKQN